MDPYEVSQILKEMAFIIEILDQNPKKSFAYLRAAKSVESIKDLKKTVKNKELELYPGIGSTLSKIIQDLVNTGKNSYYSELKKSFPEELFQLTRLGMNAKSIRKLYETYHVKNISDLKNLLKLNAKIKGFRNSTIQKIIQNLSQSEYSILYPQAYELAKHWLKILKNDVKKMEISGMLRRGLELISEIDLIAIPKASTSCLKKFTNHQLVEKIIQQDNQKATVLLKQGIKANLYLTSKEQFASDLLLTTGNKNHISELKALGFLPKKFKSEEEIYKTLSLPLIPPEMREGMSEITAAKKVNAFRLIEETDLRGTFHCHTVYSDGRNSILEMAQAAQDLGWEYIGISDHSKASYQANGMNEARLFSQVQEIQQLNKTFKNFQIFAGIECDILKDGKLDFSNDILAQLDFVIASIHFRYNQDEEAITKRLIKAIENPYTTIIGHLTGRILRHRNPSNVNVPKIIDAAIANHKIMELNAYPNRLDMDWRWWIKAKEKGLKCCINPDAHRINELKNCFVGIKMARKGWLEKNDVINTFTLKEIKRFLKKTKP